MKRRHFIAQVAGASAFMGTAASMGTAQPAADQEGSAREYYLLRRYEVRSGPQAKLANAYFQNALVPAANRLGINPVGVFHPHIGLDNPSALVLLPSRSLETLVRLEHHLAGDAGYLKAGSDFINAPANQPAYIRMESQLMIAFSGSPTLTAPAAAAEHKPRTFELRTYESPTDQDHKRKVEMFNSGEFDIFKSAGFSPVFYGDTLVGARMPQLTYMLSFGSLEERDRLWAAFGSAPAWKKLSTSPRYTFEDIVSNVTNVILDPTPYSQI